MRLRRDATVSLTPSECLVGSFRSFLGGFLHRYTLARPSSWSCDPSPRPGWLSKLARSPKRRPQGKHIRAQKFRRPGARWPGVIASGGHAQGDLPRLLPHILGLSDVIAAKELRHAGYAKARSPAGPAPGCPVLATANERGRQPRSDAARLAEPLYRRSVAQHPRACFPRLGRARSKRAVSDSRFGRKGAGAVAPPCAGRQGRRKGDRAEAGRSSFRPFGVEQTSLRPPRPVGSFGRGMVSGRRKQSRRSGRRQPAHRRLCGAAMARFDIAFERALAKPGGH